MGNKTLCPLRFRTLVPHGKCVKVSSVLFVVCFFEVFEVLKKLNKEVEFTLGCVQLFVTRLLHYISAFIHFCSNY